MQRRQSVSKRDDRAGGRQGARTQSEEIGEAAHRAEGAGADGSSSEFSAQAIEECPYPAKLPSQKERAVHVKREDTTDESMGCAPQNRTLDKHQLLGAINLDKTSGPTSHEVVAWTKKILSVEKAGHSGTLDPRVTGVLPILLGDATRVVEALLTAGKEYVCLMRIHGAVPKKRIIEVCSEFQGKIYQRPPLKSNVAKVLRLRTIYYLEILEIKENKVLMRVGCEAGTYIRKLCFDIGLALGTGANMEELRRTRAGPFTEDDGLVTLHQLKDAMVRYEQSGDPAELKRLIMPVEAALKHLPKLVISDNAVDALCHGAPLAAPGLLRLESDIEKGDVVGIYTLKGEAVAIGIAAISTSEMLAAKSGIVAHTDRVVMQPGTYRRAWKLKKRA